MKNKQKEILIGRLKHKLYKQCMYNLPIRKYPVFDMGACEEYVATLPQEEQDKFQDLFRLIEEQNN